MTIKVTKPFKGVPDGEVHPRQFNPGDVVTGALAQVALDEKWAKDTSRDKAPADTGPAAGGASNPAS